MEKNNKFDVLVIGGGIAGMQASLDLGEQGYKVLLVESYPSIGGKMIGLNKVFPTLDCSSCICTPRMAEVAHHNNVTILTYTEVKKVERQGKGFWVKLLKKPRYVNAEDCIGCSKCEYECPVYVPHEFEYGLGARKAIYIPHSNAIPQVAVLDPENCMFCGRCEKVCPTNCIDYTQQEKEEDVQVGAVVVATGLDVTPIGAKKEYGGGKFINVMNPLAMERLQAANGPYGKVLRPSDGKVPRNIAYVQCAGSRDKTLGVPYCSRVCCMYALKQAVLLKHLLHDVDITIYYMDIRAFGKGFEQFYRRALNEGVKVVKGKVAKINEMDNKDLVLRVELIDQGGKVVDVTHDLVVLSLGIVPAWNGQGILHGAELGEDGFFASAQADVAPTKSTQEGVFVAGVAAGPKDIPDSIVEAGSAAMQAAVYLEKSKEVTVTG